MKNIIGGFLLSVISIITYADDIVLENTSGIDDEILLEDIGETLNSSSQELNQMTRPDLPEATLPDIFKSIHQEIPTEPTTAEPPAEEPQVIPENVIVNIIDVRETFYRLVFNAETNIYTRTETNEARPGDLIELVISATNNGDEAVDDVEMVNNVPAGPVKLLGDSIKTDLTNSLFLLSRNGKDFFPEDAGIDPATVKYIQWIIFSMKPGQQFEFTYRIQIDK